MNDIQARFIATCLNEGNLELFYDTLFKIISDGPGFSAMSRRSGIPRENMYKIFKQKSTSLKRINMLLGAMGFGIIGTKKQQ